MSQRNFDIWAWDVPAAFALLTRLPLPTLPDAVFGNAARAVWVYPIVGATLGVLVVLLGAGLTGLGLPVLLVAGVMVGAAILMTGALHEDGLADTADGFWGGHDPTQRLDIMKDSRIGTYGVLALLLAVGLRWIGFAEVHWTALITAATLSRAAMPVLMYALPHARENGLSRQVGTPPPGSVVAAAALAGVAALTLLGPGPGLSALLTTALVAGMIGALARAKINGQTGDVLGATQVATEIAVLLMLST